MPKNAPGNPPYKLFNAEPVEEIINRASANMTIKPQPIKPTIDKKLAHFLMLFKYSSDTSVRTGLVFLRYSLPGE